jgi:hypothetical protein
MIGRRWMSSVLLVPVGLVAGSGCAAGAASTRPRAASGSS